MPHAHYWETYTTLLDDDVTAGSDGLAKWERTVLNTITGQVLSDPATRGPPVNWPSFQGDGNQRIAIIMTPLQNGEEPSGQNIKYPNKIGLVEEVIRSKIPDVDITVQPYKRLHYSMKDGRYAGVDADRVDKSERGVALFQ